MKNIFKFTRVFSILILTSLFVANATAMDFGFDFSRMVAAATNAATSTASVPTPAIPKVSSRSRGSSRKAAVVGIAVIAGVACAWHYYKKGTMPSFLKGWWNKSEINTKDTPDADLDAKDGSGSEDSTGSVAESVATSVTEAEISVTAAQTEEAAPRAAAAPATETESAESIAAREAAVAAREAAVAAHEAAIAAAAQAFADEIDARRGTTAAPAAVNVPAPVSAAPVSATPVAPAPAAKRPPFGGVKLPGAAAAAHAVNTSATAPAPRAAAAPVMATAAPAPRAAAAPVVISVPITPVKVAGPVTAEWTKWIRENNYTEMISTLQSEVNIENATWAILNSSYLSGENRPLIVKDETQRRANLIGVLQANQAKKTARGGTACR